MSKLPHISHIGIAVKDLESAIVQYRLITSSEPEICEVTDQKVKVAIFKSESAPGGRIELVAPTSDDSPIAKYLEKFGEGMHHLALEVTDIEEALQQMVQNGIPLIDEKPRKGVEDTNIAFLHPRGTGRVLLELVQG